MSNKNGNDASGSMQKSGHSWVQPQAPIEPPSVIDTFRGPFGFLSNMYEASIWVGGHHYKTVEHAYQAAKASTESGRKLIAEAKTPYEAKKLGKACPLPDDWDTKKYETMLGLVREKFHSNPLLKTMLLATEDATLTHHNHWGDRVWGIYKGQGTDWLGEILMKVRDECKRDNK